MRSGCTARHLLDSNVLIALVDADHLLHDRATRWFDAGMDFATCPITEGALIRVFMRKAPALPITAAQRLLAAFHAHPRHVFWPDNLSYVDLPETRLRGHKQVTDAYLAELARRNGALLATMDKALAALHPSAVLI